MFTNRTETSCAEQIDADENASSSEIVTLPLRANLTAKMLLWLSSHDSERLRKVGNRPRVNFFNFIIVVFAVGYATQMIRCGDIYR